jgi:hypothetical protein
MEPDLNPLVQGVHITFGNNSFPRLLIVWFYISGYIQNWIAGKACGNFLENKSKHAFQSHIRNHSFIPRTRSAQGRCKQVDLQVDQKVTEKPKGDKDIVESPSVVLLKSTLEHLQQTKQPTASFQCFGVGK